MPTAGQQYVSAFLDESDYSVQHMMATKQTIIQINKELIEIVPTCTDSMYPILSCNSKVLVEKLEPEDNVELGDIVVFPNANNAGRNLMHQVVDVDANCYYTKGTNSLINDPQCLQREDIIYRVVVVLPTK